MKPYFGSTHMHSTGSDGKLTPEEVVKKAIELKWCYVYFTDHYFPHPKYKVKPKYFLRFSKDYILEVKKLQKEYADKIRIYFGVELDWIEGYKTWCKAQTEKYDFDYVIGSIHRLKFNEKYLEIEPGKKEWIKAVRQIGGIKKVVQEYYKQIRNIVKSGIYDAVGHLDYIKIYNEKQDFFNENAEWYKQEVLKTLDLIKQNNMVMEVNVSGLRKCNSQFPSTWIIKQAKKRNIPITIGIDAHKPKHFNNKLLNKVIKIVKQAGYKEIVRFKKRKMIKMELN